MEMEDIERITYSITNAVERKLSKKIEDTMKEFEKELWAYIEMWHEDEVKTLKEWIKKEIERKISEYDEMKKLGL